jgi:hypothetical protein
VAPHTSHFPITPSLLLTLRNSNSRLSNPPPLPYVDSLFTPYVTLYVRHPLTLSLRPSFPSPLPSLPSLPYSPSPHSSHPYVSFTFTLTPHPQFMYVTSPLSLTYLPYTLTLTKFSLYSHSPSILYSPSLLDFHLL